MKKTTVFAFMASMFSINVLADAQNVAFSSLKQAQEEFKTNSNIIVRNCAYEFAKKCMNESKHSSAGTVVLFAVRQMADFLGRSHEFDAVCHDMLSSSNENVRISAATSLCDKMKKLEFPESDNKLRELMLRFGDDKKLQSIALMKLSDAAISAQKMCVAEKVADEILSFGTNAYPAANLSAGYIKMENAYSRRDYAGVEKIVFSIFRNRSDIPLGIGAKISKMRLPSENIIAIIDAIRSRVAQAALAGSPQFQTIAENAGIEVVALLCAAGRIEESLSECRVLTSLSGSVGYKNAILAAAKSLKTLDGDLGRVRECMKFHQKGVVPKGKNVLLSFPRLKDTVRLKFVEELEARKSETWYELVNKSKFYLWADEPLKALESALRAFSLAPMTKADLQLCANAAMKPIVAFSRDPGRGEKVVSYLLFGADGPDATAGTCDDVISPTDDLAEYMKFCGYSHEGVKP